MMPEPQMPVTPVLPGRLREGGIVRPQFAADHLEARLQGVSVDPHPLDRTRRRALAIADLRTLEGRARRRGAGEQLVLVAQDDLGVGADVDEERDLVVEPGRLGQDHAGAVGADMAGDAGQHVDPAARVDRVQVEVGREQVEGAVGGQREGRSAQLDRVDAQEQVVHDRVADEHQLQHVGRIGLRLGAQLAQERVHGGADGGGHLRLAARVHHRVGHPRHQILAEADLRVHHPRRGQDLAGRHVAEVRGDRGRADVDRDAEQRIVEAGPAGGDPLALVHRDGHLPLALAQRLLQAAQRVQVDGELAQAPLRLQRLLDPLEVAALPVHVRLLDLDIVEPGRGIELDRAHLGALPDHLLVHLAVGRHVDDDVAQELRLAGQPPPRLQALPALVALLDRRERAQMLGRAGDAVLGEAALAHRHLAPPADRPPAAHRVDVDAELPRRGQHRRARARTGRACPRA